MISIQLLLSRFFFKEIQEICLTENFPYNYKVLKTDGWLKLTNMERLMCRVKHKQDSGNAKVMRLGDIREIDELVRCTPELLGYRVMFSVMVVNPPY